jgi:hypothetical protein
LGQNDHERKDITLNGVGKVYLQTAIDCHSRRGRGRAALRQKRRSVEQAENNSMCPFRHTSQNDARSLFRITTTLSRVCSGANPEK